MHLRVCIMACCLEAACCLGRFFEHEGQWTHPHAVIPAPFLPPMFSREPSTAPDPDPCAAALWTPRLSQQSSGRTLLLHHQHPYPQIPDSALANYQPKHSILRP